MSNFSGACFDCNLGKAMSYDYDLPPKSSPENVHVFFDMAIGNKGAGRVVFEVWLI